MPERRLLLLLIWTSFYEQLAWAPVLVFLAAGVGDPAMVALAASAYSLANLVGNLGFGMLADRTFRLRLAGAGLLCMAVTAWLHVAAATPALLVGARFLHGLAAATVAPAAFAAVSTAAPHSRRAEAMARAGLVIAVASMLAPPLTGRLARLLGVVGAVAMLAGGLALVGIVTLFIGGDGPRWAPVRHEVAATAAVPPTPGGLDPVLSTAGGLNPVLTTVAACVAFALMFGQNVLFYALPLHGRELGMDAAGIGAILSAFAAGALVAFVPPLSRLADRHGRRLPLVAGLLLVSGSLVALAAARAAPAMAASLLFYGLGFGLVFPAVSALSADGAGSSRRGAAYGLLTAAFSAGAVAGPLAGRLLEGMMSPFALAGAVAMVGVAAVVWGLRNTRISTGADPARG